MLWRRRCRGGDKAPAAVAFCVLQQRGNVEATRSAEMALATATPSSIATAAASTRPFLREALQSFL